MTLKKKRKEKSNLWVFEEWNSKKRVSCSVNSSPHLPSAIASQSGFALLPKQLRARERTFKIFTAEVLRLQCASESPGGCHRLLGPLSGVSDAGDLGWVPRFCISIRFPGDADAADPGTTMENHWFSWCSYAYSMWVPWWNKKNKSLCRKILYVTHKKILSCVLLKTLFLGAKPVKMFAETRPVRLDCSNELHDYETNLAKKGKWE